MALEANDRCSNSRRGLKYPACTRKDGENTLDYWAGMHRIPTTLQIEKQTAQLTGTALLKRGALLVKARRRRIIFDLGGNVAEWVLSVTAKAK